MSVVLLAVAVIVLFLLRRFGPGNGRLAGGLDSRCARLALGYLARSSFWPRWSSCSSGRSSTGIGHRMGLDDHAGGDQRPAADRPDRPRSPSPLNTIFGIGTALVLVRGKTRARKLLDVLIDLPFVVSPVIVGLALILVYGQGGWFGDWFIHNGIRIIYAVPGMVIATVFVSLPFVVREVAPVLIEIGDEQEQAAATLGAGGWQTFWRVTLPAIRWGVAYGVVLTTARALGEIGAVLVVSSNVAGSTLTLPLLVYQRSPQNFGSQAVTSTYAAATELIVLSLVVLVAMTVLTGLQGGGPK